MINLYFYCLVPTSSGQYPRLGIDPFHNLDRRVMLSYLGRLASRDVEHTACVVCATREDFVSFLYMNNEGMNHKSAGSS